MQLPHLDFQLKEGNHSWIFHVPIYVSGHYIYTWYELRDKKRLMNIPFGIFIVLRGNAMHGGICVVSSNVRVHGGIFDSVAIKTSHCLM